MPVRNGLATSLRLSPHQVDKHELDAAATIATGLSTVGATAPLAATTASKPPLTPRQPRFDAQTPISGSRRWDDMGLSERGVPPPDRAVLRGQPREF